ncbi:MAG: metal-dependent phosphohydrolase [Elainellaceae cyanobacterium]
MLDLTFAKISRCNDYIQTSYRQMYGDLEPTNVDLINTVVGKTLSIIANSDALYHNLEHTILVISVGQEILLGKQLLEGSVTRDDWLHFTIALLCHDIGYVRGACSHDQTCKNCYVTGASETLIELADNTTDASLTPYHVDRGKLFVSEMLKDSPNICLETIQQTIELTRFPVPAEARYQTTTSYPGLARAADLIGQLSDPHYLKKIPALFYEMEETGASRKLGYRHPGDMRASYPEFYRKVVYPYIQDSLLYLEVTAQGRQTIANLYRNVFIDEDSIAA